MTWAVKLIEKHNHAGGLGNWEKVITIDDLVLAVLEKNKENEQKVLKEAKKCKLCKINDEAGWDVCLEHVELRTNLEKDEARAFRELVSEAKRVQNDK